MSVSLVSQRIGFWQRVCERVQTRAAHGGPAEPVLVYTAVNAIEADLVIALLTSEDIPAFATGATLSQTYGMVVGPLAEVNIWVSAALAERARRLIETRHLRGEESTVSSHS
ncbi:MAG: DUF2007 domain-containing protein [Anaerolineae bacterium]|nr:DUF2007 domain-containing protein [Anaerolineae bacterium]